MKDFSGKFVRLGAIVSVALVGSALFAAPAVGQVSCGDRITDKRTLDADLTCPFDNPAIIVDGGSLDLAGHTLAAPTGTAVRLVGGGARLANGKVEFLGTGVELRGDGGHSMANLVLSGFGAGMAENTGISIESAKNKIESCVVSSPTIGIDSTDASERNSLRNVLVENAERDGIVLRGGLNKLVDNVVIGTEFSERGVWLLSDGNKLSGNSAVDWDYGITVAGQNNKLKGDRVSGARVAGVRIADLGNSVQKCFAIDNEVGVELLEGDASTVSKCVLIRNGVGVRVLATNESKVAKNAIVTTSHESGIEAEWTTGVEIASNRILGNANDVGIGMFESLGAEISKNLLLGGDAFGVAVADSDETEVSGNTVYGFGVVDLIDSAADCGTTTWSGNEFGISVPADCIE